MTKLERLLVESGMTGSGWQVCKRAMVSTANLLRTDGGYVVVDLESGIPSVLVPSYIVAGFKTGSLPLFDDLNPVLLTSWIEDHRNDLEKVLSSNELEQFRQDVIRLIEHDKVKPSYIVSHELPLADAPGAYAHFDEHKSGWTKVVLKPGR